MQQSWRRYSDIQVTQEEEETVFSNSSGGKGWMSAYLLVYLNTQNKDTLKTLNINYFKPTEGVIVDANHPFS